MRLRHHFPTKLAYAITLAAILVGAGSAAAQDADDDPVSIGDSGAGYIDSAVIGNNARFRFDAAYGSNKPNRGEFIWAWTPPSGNGPARSESRVDYQRFSAYVEWAPSDDFSVFVDAPAVLSNPTINDNTAGFGDMEAGFKLALCRECNTLVTFQMKTYLPTGDEKSGMGTGHVSIEPGLLFLHRQDWVTFEGELRHWIPIEGTPNDQGNVTRYGVGASSNLAPIGLPKITPVVEAVGWTFLNGRARYISAGGSDVREDSGGDTIVNLKIGSRYKLTECSDVYVGYGRALTGDRLYQDILRLELRHKF